MLELELADLKLQQHQEKAAQEHTQMQLYAEQVSQLMTTEKNLRLQLASDGERFQQFQVHSLTSYKIISRFQMARAYIMVPLDACKLQQQQQHSFGPNQVGVE